MTKNCSVPTPFLSRSGFPLQVLVRALLKRQTTQQGMTKNGLDILTKWTDFQIDRVLLLGQVTEGNEKPTLRIFLNFF